MSQIALPQVSLFDIFWRLVQNHGPVVPQTVFSHRHQRIAGQNVVHLQGVELVSPRTHSLLGQGPHPQGVAAASEETLGPQTDCADPHLRLLPPRVHGYLLRGRPKPPLTHIPHIFIINKTPAKHWDIFRPLRQLSHSFFLGGDRI